MILTLLFALLLQAPPDCDSPTVQRYVDELAAQRGTMREFVDQLAFVEAHCRGWVFEDVEEETVALPAGAYVVSLVSANDYGFLYADGCGVDFIEPFPPGRTRHALVELPNGCDSFLIGVEEPTDSLLWIRSLD